MKHLSWCLCIFCTTFLSSLCFAQGPPITGDKPIMLGAKRLLVKTLSEIRNTEEGTFAKTPLMVHYLPTASSLLGIHIPLTFYDFKYNQYLGSGTSIGDIEILGKYQFYRKDKMAKTFRMVAKTLQILPTGKELGIEGMNTQLYQSYVALVAGYESIKYGISNELGYNLVPNGEIDELRYKLGFGLPLLKPTYPVNQINLYFEYQSSWFVEADEYMLLYAQGIQYAKNQLTVEVSIQLPMIQTVSSEKERNYSLFLGTRYVF